MATSETEVNASAPSTGGVELAPKSVAKKNDSILDRVLTLLSSVRFGLVMLGLLLTCCMIGMLVMQVNVQGFEKYYNQITPAQRLVYGALGFFDIYRSWYFKVLLAITGLNIILASIDRFPAAWQYIVKPKLQASPKFIAAQMFVAEAESKLAPHAFAEKIKAAWRERGFRARVGEDNNRITLFAQKNVWNRLGAYVVHIALLTIFVGGFLTSRYGKGGSMEIEPGMPASNKFIATDFGPDGKPRQSEETLPFKIECRDLRQKLIDPHKGLDVGNTMDWESYITIVDGDKREDLFVHLNNVGDYRGYRFFQSQFSPVGNARVVRVAFVPEGGGEERRAEIQRGDFTDVEGIGRVFYEGFAPDFTDQRSPEYGEGTSAAGLVVTADGKQSQEVIAFGPELFKEFAGKKEAKNLLHIGDKTYAVRLDDFEKQSTTHTLTIQYDPGRTPVYIGFTLLFVALCGVFFFSHQRVWAVIEPNGKGSKAYLGGNTNRNRSAFEGRFNTLVESVKGGGSKDE